MATTNRRDFLESVGAECWSPGLAPSLGQDLGSPRPLPTKAPRSLSFGPYDALVDLMQSTPPEKLQPMLDR